ncbi:MAG: hypothetical protein ACRD3C_07085 [Vicinamibacterales bacterium]
MRIPNVWRAVVNRAGVRLRRLQRHGRTVIHALQRAGRRAKRYGEGIPQVPALARARVQRGQAAVERAGKRIRRFDDHVLAPHRTERRIKRMLARATSGQRPIIVGPWTSEVGYEVLYWLPFLRWAMDRYAVGADRLVALSRGGAAVWYEGIAERYVEIFDLVEPSTFAAHAAARHGGGDQKQAAPGEFDRHLIALACQRLGVESAALWYPGLMYQLFRSFWYGDRSRHFLFRHTDFRYPRIAARAGQPSLPPEYVAMKFYTGPALPETERNRELIRDLVERVAARIPVVMFDTAWTTDEHRDYAVDGIRGVTTLRPSLDPRTNLGLQTRVMAGARQFVGTCGGLAWLAPFLGVDTVAVYDDDRYLTAHLYAARYAYRKSGAARFSTLNVRALRHLRAAVASAS